MDKALIAVAGLAMIGGIGPHRQSNRIEVGYSAGAWAICLTRLHKNGGSGARLEQASMSVMA